MQYSEHKCRTLCCSYFLFLTISCKIAGEKFGSFNPTKVTNKENAEIDDIDVIRDGDHLFLLCSDSENLSS